MFGVITVQRQYGTSVFTDSIGVFVEDVLLEMYVASLPPAGVAGCALKDRKKVQSETIRKERNDSKWRIEPNVSATMNDDEPWREREQEERPLPRSTYCVSRIGRTRIPIETRGARGYMCDVSTSMCSSVFRRVARSETDVEWCRVSMCVPRERVCARGRPFAGAPRYRTRCRAQTTNRRHSPRPFPRTWTRVHGNGTRTVVDSDGDFARSAAHRSGGKRRRKSKAKRRDLLVVRERSCMRVCNRVKYVCTIMYMCMRGRGGDLPDVLGQSAIISG